VITPHAAFYSPSALEDMQRKAIEVIVAYLRDGTLMNCVNHEYLADGCDEPEGHGKGPRQ
jgi:D-3-phosphoglycerate dehydrogenase/C-terminal binding protein